MKGIHNAPSGAPSGQRNPYTKDAKDVMLSSATRESVLAIADGIILSLTKSGFPSLCSKQALIHSAATLSELCTKQNLNALTLSEAVLICRHNIGCNITPAPNDERMQQRFVAMLALNDAMDGKDYKDVLYRQSEFIGAHLCLPYEGMMAFATQRLTGIGISFNALLAQYAELQKETAAYNSAAQKWELENE